MTDEQIQQIFQDMRQVLQIARSQHTPNVAQGEARVLHYLRQTGGQGQPGELSRALHLSTARVAVILGSLERKGELVRQPLGQDRRCVRVCLTDAGNARLDAIYAHMRRKLSYVLEALGPEDAQAFCRILHRLPDIMRASEPQKGEI